MLSTNFVTHLAVFSFDIDSFWKLQMIKLKLSDRPIGILCLISLAHWATRLLFLLAQDRNLLAPGNWTWTFSYPE